MNDLIRAETVPTVFVNLQAALLAEMEGAEMEGAEMEGAAMPLFSEPGASPMRRISPDSTTCSQGACHGKRQ
jgi:hypothetical protein